MQQTREWFKLPIEHRPMPRDTVWNAAYNHIDHCCRMGLPIEFWTSSALGGAILDLPPAMAAAQCWRSCFAAVWSSILGGAGCFSICDLSSWDRFFSPPSHFWTNAWKQQLFMFSSYLKWKVTNFDIQVKKTNGKPRTCSRFVISTTNNYRAQRRDKICSSDLATFTYAYLRPFATMSHNGVRRLFAACDNLGRC